MSNPGTGQVAFIGLVKQDGDDGTGSSYIGNVSVKMHFGATDNIDVQCRRLPTNTTWFVQYAVSGAVTPS